jgi:hypothetical protein
VPNAEIPISALQNFNVPEVLVELLSYCQNRQRIIQRSIDRQERFVNETIREKYY